MFSEWTVSGKPVDNAEKLFFLTLHNKTSLE